MMRNIPAMKNKETDPYRCTVTLDGISIEVRRKKIRNINLRVHVRKGEVKLSAPFSASDDEIRSFLLQKAGWIRKHLSKQISKPLKAPEQYENGDQIFVWGRKSTLKLQPPVNGRACVYMERDNLIIEHHGKSTAAKREHLVREWYRRELKREIPKIIARYEPVMGVAVREFGVKKMKTRWGSCNTREKRIWLNLNLAERDPVLLEYVTVHEMVHLLERGHNRRFYNYMDAFLPHWREYDRALKRS